MPTYRQRSPPRTSSADYSPAPTIHNEGSDHLDCQLTKYEKETIILYNQSNERINLSGYDKKLFRKLAEHAERHPDFCRRIDKHKYEVFKWLGLPY